MSGKKVQIMRAATKLFSEKGFHATSIQEIADSLGIAKGSVYSYFPSKDELLFSIFKYYYELYEYKLAKIGEDRSLDTREALIAKIEHMFNGFYEHRAFILMHLKEQPIKHAGDLYEFLVTAGMRSNMMYAAHLREMFRELPERYLSDCVAMLSGLTDAYMKVLVVGQQQLDHHKMATFIVERLEDIVAGLLARNAEACLSADLLNIGQPEKLLSARPALAVRLENELCRLKKQLCDHDGSAQAKETLGALQVLEEELGKPAPRKFILKGMAGQIADNVDATALLELLETLLGFDEAE